MALVVGLAPRSARAQDDYRLCFTETEFCLTSTFKEYWQQNGGLMVFGFPITSDEYEPNNDLKRVFLTQWLERNRFELHLENEPPYHVLLGRLGVERLQQLGIDWQTLPKANPSDPHYFPQTGQAISFESFWQYWRTHGLELGDRGISERESLALFGYPISPARMETNSSGDTVLTQWFERARFEWHPNNPEPYKVLLGLLGREVHDARPPLPVDPPAEQCAGVPPLPPEVRSWDQDTIVCLYPYQSAYFSITGFQPNQVVHAWRENLQGERLSPVNEFETDEEGTIYWFVIDGPREQPSDYVVVCDDPLGKRPAIRLYYRVLPLP
ncbi:hypothetical protein [Kallotenue papyrolyticum]|uniref:hypothetical protein n=1 Tax=Kallotenue papyrolyticum TaxID=1325125 RepID=UPI0012682CB8|nr:hypothetical protein [Kallotenue papyrolyticum]